MPLTFVLSAEGKVDNGDKGIWLIAKVHTRRLNISLLIEYKYLLREYKYSKRGVV